ncbi:hypothetical protein QFC21_002028 [Naganishia friedmannii]|uniref:Uncharacterized protein n=1 Tax=Naganishia friedmannii TaxID=89922 RepID=A0ACC2W0A3_9TREE|nr:hypothetical protein QFC21_002028 [Naganishia friedmannii]
MDPTEIPSSPERLAQGQATSSTASQTPHVEDSTDRSTSIPESPYAGVNVYYSSSPELEGPAVNTATALPIDPRNLLPLSVPGTPGMSPSPSISRSASPATGFSNNAVQYDSPRGSVSFDRDSDQASRSQNGFGSATATTDATGSEFETEDDEIQTGTSLSTRMPWSRNQQFSQDRPPNGTSNWPWRTRRGTDDPLFDRPSADQKNGHTRTISNEYSPLKTHAPNASLPGRLESLTTIDSSIHSSFSYGNQIPGHSPQSTTYTQYSDYHSMPSNPNEPTSKSDQANSAIAAFSSELGKQRRGLRRLLGWIKRRVGVGASGVADLASEASQRVAETTNGTIRLPSGSLGSRRRSRKRKNAKSAGHDASWVYQLLRLVPTQPSTIILALLLLGAFAVSLTMSLKYLLNPDKAPLPWRDYCQSPYPDYFALKHPPNFNYSSGEHRIRLSMEQNLLTLPGASADLLQKINSTHPAWPFPGQEDMPYSAESSLVDTLEPVGLFIGVFTTDEGRERRMMIRQTYGTHPKSRVPGTEGVRLRFVMGRPRARYERAVKLEMDTDHAMVPDWDYSSSAASLEGEDTTRATAEDKYRSRLQRRNRASMHKGGIAVNEDMPESQGLLQDERTSSHSDVPASVDSDERVPRESTRKHPVYRGEKRPDYIVKADEDSFLVLGELERRLRVAPRKLTYWGYLVKDLFMAGECYAMSYDLAYFIGKAETFETMTRGAEDKLVARWMRMHPRREEISWVSEKCWIYDHPKAGTVYAHGYLFPATVDTVRHENITELPEDELALRGGKTWATTYSTVSKFGTRYSPPSAGMTPLQEVEALIEGSEMSLLGRSDSNSQRSKKNQPLDPQLLQEVYDRRLSRAQRFRNDPRERGGTAIVHYIKRQEWFMETALALLGPSEGGYTPTAIAASTPENRAKKYDI